MKNSAVTLSSSITVNASESAVFAAITDWAAQSEWMVGTSVRATKKDGHAKDGEIAAFTGIGSIGFTDTMVITVWDPPRQCSVTHTGNIVKGSGDFIVRSLGGQKSEFTWSEQLILPFGRVGRYAWPLIKPFAKLGLIISLRRFARWVESR